MNTDTTALYAAPQGLDIAIVGGDPRDAQTDRLLRAFALHDVVHRPTRQSDPSPRLFEAALQGPRIVLAIWLCGLSRTSHGRQFRAICKRLGIPSLDCPRIPHPNLLAARVHDLRLLDAIVRRRNYLMASLLTGGGR